MKVLLGILTLLETLTVSAQVKSKTISIGFDYRQFPIDIENVPRGPYSSNAMPDDGNFWQVLSLHASYGVQLKKNWHLSISGYGRYNHNHYLQGENFANPSRTKKKEKKKLKLDLFLDTEKKFTLAKNMRRFLTAKFGLGFTNINTGYDVFLQDTLASGATTQGLRYIGNYLHFGPRLNMGYQHNRVKFSVDTYIIEGPDLTNLTSLWIGFSMNYEIPLKTKGRNK